MNIYYPIKLVNLFILEMVIKRGSILLTNYGNEIILFLWIHHSKPID